MLTALLFLLSPGISPLSIGAKYSTIFRPVYLIATVSSAPAIYLTSLANPVSTSNAEAYFSLFASQFIIYLSVGIITAYLIFPLWEKFKKSKFFEQ
jgi:hypothetical protein